MYMGQDGCVGRERESTMYIPTYLEVVMLLVREVHNTMYRLHLFSFYVYSCTTPVTINNIWKNSLSGDQWSMKHSQTEIQYREYRVQRTKDNINSSCTCWYSLNLPSLPRKNELSSRTRKDFQCLSIHYISNQCIGFSYWHGQQQSATSSSNRTNIDTSFLRKSQRH